MSKRITPARLATPKQLAARCAELEAHAQQWRARCALLERQVRSLEAARDVSTRAFLRGTGLVTTGHGPVRRVAP